MKEICHTIIRNFKHCSDAVKCQLFKSFCTSFYCASLWSCYTIESLRHLKVAYNRIFRILMGMHHRTRMSENLISRGLDPFKVIVRKLSWSFRSRVLQSDNMLLKIIVNSMYFMRCKLSRKWNAAILNLKWWACYVIHYWLVSFVLFFSFLSLVVFVYLYMFTSCLLCAMECIFWNKDILSYLIL